MSRQGQGGGTSDATTSFFWVLVLITLAGLSLWYVFSARIAHVIFDIKRVEALVIHDVIFVINFLLAILHLPLIDDAKLIYWHKTVSAHVDYSKVVWRDVTYIGLMIGDYLRIPVILSFCGMAYILWYRHPASRFNRTFTMDTLRRSEARLWPQIKPSFSDNLHKLPLNEGKWAMSKLPLDFSREHDLLLVAKDKDGETCYQVKSKEVDRVFSMQMGGLWKGVDALPLYLRALVLVFLAKIERKNELAQKFIRQIADSSVSGQLDFRGVDEALATFRRHKILPWIANRHAYVTTFMATLLFYARSNGVLATSEFLWLKPIDRGMWYMLNSVGRQTAVSECAGPFAHWLAEKKIGRALRTPMIEQATRALTLSIDEILYVEGQSWQDSTEA